MKLSSRKLQQNPYSLNIASLIDVVFLLLIFFLVTATFRKNEGTLSPAVQTRTATAAKADLEQVAIRVELDPAGAPVFRVGQRTFRKQTELQAFLSALAALDDSQNVSVQAANDVPAEYPVAALQACRDARFERVSYVPTNTD